MADSEAEGIALDTSNQRGRMICGSGSYVHTGSATSNYLGIFKKSKTLGGGAHGVL